MSYQLGMTELWMQPTNMPILKNNFQARLLSSGETIVIIEGRRECGGVIKWFSLLEKKYVYKGMYILFVCWSRIHIKALSIQQICSIQRKTSFFSLVHSEVNNRVKQKRKSEEVWLAGTILLTTSMFSSTIFCWTEFVIMYSTCLTWLALVITITEYFMWREIENQS